jgi:hypothetical protein
MAIIVVSAIASLQSELMGPRGDLFAYLRTLGLIVGLVIVYVGVRRRGSERNKPQE